MFRWRTSHPARRQFVTGHEGLNSLNNTTDGPKRIPRLRVKVAHAHAKFGIDLESTTGSQHVNRRRFHWILGWKNEFSNVNPSFEGCSGWSSNPIEPLENVAFVRFGNDVRGRCFFQVD